MKTGEIIAVAAGVAILGGGLIYLLHRQNLAALQAQVTPRAAAASAAKQAGKSDSDLGIAIVQTGGRVLERALPYIFGGADDAQAADALDDAKLV